MKASGKCSKCLCMKAQKKTLRCLQRPKQVGAKIGLEKRKEMVKKWKNNLNLEPNINDMR